MRGSAALAGAIVALWSVVYLVTQVLVAPALPVLPTMAIGVALTVGAMLGYPSALPVRAFLGGCVDSRGSRALGHPHRQATPAPVCGTWRCAASHCVRD